MGKVSNRVDKEGAFLSRVINTKPGAARADRSRALTARLFAAKTPLAGRSDRAARLSSGEVSFVAVVLHLYK